jgi:hypothetical protein
VVLESRESLTIEGRDIEEVLPRSTPTELTVRAIVLQIKTRELYGLNVPAITATNARIPLDSAATTAVIQRRCLLEADIAVEAVAMEEREAQHQLLLLPHQSLQEPVQS